MNHPSAVLHMHYSEQYNHVICFLQQQVHMELKDT